MDTLGIHTTVFSSSPCYWLPAPLGNAPLPLESCQKDDGTTVSRREFYCMYKRLLFSWFFQDGNPPRTKMTFVMLLPNGHQYCYPSIRCKLCTVRCINLQLHNLTRASSPLWSAFNPRWRAFPAPSWQLPAHLSVLVSNTLYSTRQNEPLRQSLLVP